MKNTRKLTLTALLTTMLCISSFIQIPFYPVPITLQTLFVLLFGLTLPPKYCALGIASYIILGLMGLPVFAGGVGGLERIFSPSFGFIIAFLISSVTISFLRKKYTSNSLKTTFALSMLATIIIYLIGLPYMYFIINLYLKNPMNFMTALRVGMILFIPGDIVKAIIATVFCEKIKYISQIDAD